MKPCAAIHRLLVNRLDSISPGRLLHLGCGHPGFLPFWHAAKRVRWFYSGYEESAAETGRLTRHFPFLSFTHQQLDTVMALEAEVIVVGTGIFRMCGGGAAQLLHNLKSASFLHLFVATVPGADNASREARITTPRTPLPLDAVALGILPVPPREVIRHPDSEVAFAHWVGAAVERL